MSKIVFADLEQAVADGLITTAQRDGILALSTSRSSSLLDESEPLEIFHGFAEIFVTIGLIILLAGVGAGLAELTNETIAMFGITISALGLGHYYILRRHMLLPAIVLTFVVAAAFTMWAAIVADSLFDANYAVSLAVSGALTFGAMAVYHRYYKVAFAIFAMGLAGAGVVFGLTLLALGIELDGDVGRWLFGNRLTADLRTIMTVAGLVFGLLALAAALAFDVKDPNRTGRASKCGFWLHLLAGPALINAVALQLDAIDGGVGYALTFILLLVAALLALVIDRRSFLTAGILYLAALIGWATTGLGDYEFVVEILVLGLIITALGTWWHRLRAGLFRLLPDGAWQAMLPPIR